MKRNATFIFIVTLLNACNAGHSTIGARQSALVPYTVGAYYYPWYGDNFHGGGYLREHLMPPQYPTLGEYNDSENEVIAQHLAWSRQSHVSLWVTSWWGAGRREDRTLLENILPHSELGDTKIALFYETTGLTDNFADFSNVGSDITYMAEHYFEHPNYQRIDGKPVVFVYLTRVLTRNNTLAELVELMRQAALNAGHEIYIVGDEVFGQAPDASLASDSLGLLDAVTNYDVYGSMATNGYVGQERVDTYYAAQSCWRELAHGKGVDFIPAATPGFNDKGVRQGHASVSRKLNEDAEFGSLFRAMLEQAVEYTDDATGKMLLITSWNEWHEDTQIEPVASAPATSLDASGTGDSFSEGLSYEGYGERYLDILREVVEEAAE